MSQTFYLKKFARSQSFFNKSSIFQDNKDDNKSSSNLRAKNSYKNLKNYKTTNNFRKKNNIIEKGKNNILTPINKESSQKINSNFITSIPINHKISNFRFNKAPTLKQNQIEINKIIKKKKLIKMKELNSIYNNILINESKTFRNNLYITGCGCLTQKAKKIRRNKSSDELIFKQYNSSKSINEINNSSSGNYNQFIKNPININYSKNIFEKENRIINESTTLKNINNVRNNSTNNLLPISLNTSRKNNFILLLNPITKMRMMVNEVIFNEIQSVKQFSEKENKLIKFRVIQNLKNKEIKNMKNKNDFDIESNINKLIEFKNLIEINYFNYSYKLNLYINFLKNKIYEIKDNIFIIDKEIFNKNIDIEKLVLKIVKKQKELEYLVEIRNFLLKVKEKYEKIDRQPLHYYILLIKDSKKLMIGNYFLNLKLINQITHKPVTAFMSSVLELKEKLEDNKIIIDDFDFKLGNFKNEKIEPIFESTEEFMKLYNCLMERNLNYLQQFEYIKKALEKLKKKYKEILDEDNNNSLLEVEINEDTELKNSLIKKNEILQKRFIYYKDIILNKRKNIEIHSLKKTKNRPNYLDIEIDLDLIYTEKYNNQKKYLKYNGILLLEKVISVVKNVFLEGYAKDFFEKFFQKNKINILEINKSMFNDDNIQLIDDYILKIFTLYEEICKYTLSNHQKYLSNKKNSEFIQILQGKINTENHLRILKEQRKMKIIKNNEEMTKIIEKCYKPIYYIENKITIDSKIKRFNILKLKDEKRLEDEENNFAENEFNNFTKYNDDDII